MINLSQKTISTFIWLLLMFVFTVGIQAQDSTGQAGVIVEGEAVPPSDASATQPLTAEDFQPLLDQNFDGEFDIITLNEVAVDIQTRLKRTRDNNPDVDPNLYLKIYKRIIAHLIETHQLSRFGREIPDMFISKPTGRTVYWAYVVGYATSCGGSIDWTISQVPPLRTQTIDAGTIYLDAPITLFIEGDKVINISPHSTYHGDTDQTLFVDNGRSDPFIGFNAPVPIDVDITIDVHRRWNVQPNQTGIEPYMFAASLNTYLSQGECANAAYFVFVDSSFPQLDVACWLPFIDGPTPNIVAPDVEPSTNMADSDYNCRLPESELLLDEIRDNNPQQVPTDLEDTPSDQPDNDTSNQPDNEPADAPDDTVDQTEPDESPDDQSDRSIRIDSIRLRTSPMPGKITIVETDITNTTDENVFVDAYADLNGDGEITEDTENIARNIKIEPNTKDNELVGFQVPDTPTDGEVKLRFRYNTTADSTPTNLEPAGGIEYQVKVRE